MDMGDELGWLSLLSADLSWRRIAPPPSPKRHCERDSEEILEDSTHQNYDWRKEYWGLNSSWLEQKKHVEIWKMDSILIGKQSEPLDAAELVIESGGELSHRYWLQRNVDQTPQKVKHLTENFSWRLHARSCCTVTVHARIQPDQYNSVLQ